MTETIQSQDKQGGAVPPHTGEPPVVDFDALGPLGQLIALLFMGFARERDPSLEENKTASSFFALVLGFGEDQAAYQNWWNGNFRDGGDWTRTTDFSHFDFSSARRYVGSRPLPRSGNADFDEAVKIVLGIEGGYNPNEPGGAIANFGINSAANPDIDIKNLTREQAIAIYKERYWDVIPGMDRLDRASALVVFDASVNHGPGFARKMLEATGGDVQRMLEYRRERYVDLVRGKPETYGRFAAGWEQRLQEIGGEAHRMAFSAQGRMSGPEMNFDRHAEGVPPQQVAEAPQQQQRTFLQRLGFDSRNS